MRERAHLVFFALLAVAASGFGQTFFISIFGGALREEFGLSNAWYGATYSAATLVSAIGLLACGSLVDRWPLRRITAVVVTVLALACLLMASASHALMLLPGFFLLRFAGQGFMTHLGMTTAGRYFSSNRGKVIAVAALGFPLAEALLPTGGAWLIEAFGWRSAWLASALALLCLALPALLWLARTESRSPGDSTGDGDPGEGFSRGQVMRDPGFYLLLPAALMTPMVVTAVLFHQGAIGEARGWSLTLLGSAFGGYAAGHLLMLFLAGSLVDRFGAQRSLPLALLPMVAGLALLAFFEKSWVPMAYLTLLGITQAGTGTAAGAMWPERYGTRHLGAIRAVSQGAMILSTAISPLLVGILLDAGVGVAPLAGALGTAVAGSMALAMLAPAARR